MNFSSSIIKNAVEAISNLPGIGQKTALRLVIYLLRNKKISYTISNSIRELVDKINYCSNCFNITEFEHCEICRDSKRDKNTICIVLMVMPIQFHFIFVLML